MVRAIEPPEIPSPLKMAEAALAQAGEFLRQVTAPLTEGASPLSIVLSDGTARLPEDISQLLNTIAIANQEVSNAIAKAPQIVPLRHS